MSRKKPLVLDLSAATGTNTVPLHVKDAEGQVRKFAIPERTDDVRSRMLAQMQAAQSDAHVAELAADWLVAASTDGLTRAEALALAQRPSALPQLLTVLLTGRLPDPKVMDQLLARLLDRVTGALVQAI